MLPLIEIPPAPSFPMFLFYTDTDLQGFATVYYNYYYFGISFRVLRHLFLSWLCFTYCSVIIIIIILLLQRRRRTITTGATAATPPIMSYILVPITCRLHDVHTGLKELYITSLNGLVLPQN